MKDEDIIPLADLKMSEARRNSAYGETQFYQERRLRSNSSTSVATLESSWESDSFRITSLRLFKTELDAIEQDLELGKPGSIDFCFDYYMHLQRKKEILITRINKLLMPSDRFLEPVRGEFDETAKHAFQLLPYAYDIEPGHIVCINTFTAKHKDDLVVGIGHKVVISLIFTDGLAHGFNKSTGSTGMLPLSCLSISDPDIKMTSLPKHSKKSLASLQFCLIPPPQALEIVNSLSRFRKHMYFEKARVSQTRKKISARDLVLDRLASASKAWISKRRNLSFWKVIVESYDKT